MVGMRLQECWLESILEAVGFYYAQDLDLEKFVSRQYVLKNLMCIFEFNVTIVFFVQGLVH